MTREGGGVGFDRGAVGLGVLGRFQATESHKLILSLKYDYQGVVSPTTPKQDPSLPVSGSMVKV